MPALLPPLDTGLAQAARHIFNSESAGNLVRSCLDRITELDEQLGCVVCLDTEGAFARATELDRYKADGAAATPLHGIPVLVKEIYSVAGLPDSAASRAPVPDVFGGEGTVVRRLRELGCIILGKTVSTEFALGQFNGGRPMPVNPADYDRVTGGSSCGSAAAMAAGYCGFTVGTDTGGSVRAPAAFCGVTGFKPAAGNWPMDGVFPLSAWLDSPGIFTRSVADTAYVYDHFIGAAHTPLPAVDKRIGMPTSYFFERLDSVVMKAVDTAKNSLQSVGYELVPLDFPSMEPVAEYFLRALPLELLTTLGQEHCSQNLGLMEPLTARRLQSAMSATGSAPGRESLETLRVSADAALRQADVRCWLSPTVPGVAPLRKDLENVDQLLEWQALASRNTRCINGLGMTAISLPIPGDLPAGLQLAAPAGDERRLLATAMEVAKYLLR